jgi:hypothetical protein
MIRIYRVDLLIVVALISLALIGNWLAHLPMRSSQLDLQADATQLRRDGLYALEYSPPPVEPFRWAGDMLVAELINPGGALQYTLRLQGATATATTQLATPSGNVSLPLDITPRRYLLLLPPVSRERLPITLTSALTPDPNSNRALGVQVRAIQVFGGGAAPGSVGAGLIGATLILFGALRLAEMGRPLAAVLTALALGAALLLRTTSDLQDGAFMPRLLIGALIGASAVLGWVLLREVRPLPRSAGWPHWRRWLLGGSALGGYLALAVWNSRVIHPDLGLDLVNYLIAGEDMLRGINPYGRFSLDLIGAGFIYTPATLPLFALLSQLPFAQTWAIWYIGNIALYLMALLAIWLSLPAAEPTERSGAMLLISVVLALGSTTFLESLAIGQINSLMLLGMALFLYGQRNPRMAWLGDIALASAILIKLTPGLLLLWPLVRRDWMRLGRVALGGVLLCLPSLLAFGITPWLQFIVLLPSLLQGPTANPYNQSLGAVLTALAPEQPLWALSAGLSGRLFTLLLLGSWVWYCWRERMQHGPGPLALGVLVLSIGSNLIWHHHLMFLLVPALWIFFRAPVGSVMRPLVLVALLLLQSTRIVERTLEVPAITAVAGYLLLFGLWIWLGRTQQGTYSKAA